MTPIEKAIELKHKMYAKILDYNIDYTDSNNIEQLNIFDDNAKHSEAVHFLEGRENNTLEISWEGILVALLHNRNTSTKIIVDQSPNGCHYGWSDELFLFITSLDRDLTEEEKEKRNHKTQHININKKILEDDDHLPS